MAKVPFIPSRRVSDTERKPLALWFIYDKPSDWHKRYIAKRVLARDGEIFVTHEHLWGDDIEAIRIRFLRAGLEIAPKSPGSILEIWVEPEEGPRESLIDT